MFRGCFLKKILTTSLFTSILYLMFLSHPAAAFAQQPELPAGFYEIDSTVGIQLYRKDYPGGNPDYVQVIDLSQGAELHLLHGDIKTAREGRGAYGGSDPHLGYNSLKGYWNEINNSQENAFCVTNGQFFYMPESPTRLPLPLKVDGQIITDGYALDEFVGQKLILEIWDDRVDITPLSKNSLYGSYAPNVVAGLSEHANKRAKHYTGRTFIGVDDRNRDGRNEIVLIFNTKTARQVDAAQVLRDFGADKVMMLDGGGSTQLICKGNSYVSSDRLIPQAIAVTGGTQPTPIPTATLAPTPLAVPTPGSPPGGLLSQAPPPEQGTSSPNESAPGTLFQLEDLIWIPIAMLPVETLLIIIIFKIRQIYASAGTF